MGAPMEMQQTQEYVEVAPRLPQPPEPGVNWAIWVPVIATAITTLGGVVIAWINVRAGKRKRAAEAAAAKK